MREVEKVCSGFCATDFVSPIEVSHFVVPLKEPIPRGLSAEKLTSGGLLLGDDALIAGSVFLF